MKNKINQLLEEVKQFNAESIEQLEQFRIRFLGRKGLLQDLFDAFKELPGDQKRDVGQLLNVLKNEAQDKIVLLRNLLKVRFREPHLKMILQSLPIFANQGQDIRCPSYVTK